LILSKPKETQEMLRAMLINPLFSEKDEFELKLTEELKADPSFEDVESSVQKEM
jgi:hypothetical protein